MGSFGSTILELPVLLLNVIWTIVLELVLEWINSWAEIFVPEVAMEHQKISTMEKLRKLFKLDKEKVTLGVKSSSLFPIPVYQRSDGVTIKLGSYVLRRNEESKIEYNVKNILVQADLTNVYVVLIPTDCSNEGDKSRGEVDEEMTVTVRNIEELRSKGICPIVARDGMEAVAIAATKCPFHVQKFIRKHQISSSMRKEVQKFLGGFSMAGSCSLGCVNWHLDPVILGLERDTDFSMEYRVERSVDNVSHMDLLMGSLWDVRNICGTDGFRIILTLELMVDSNQELLLKMHATLISGKIEPDTYRTVCLKDTSNLHMICNRRLSDITNNRTRRLSDITNNASGAVITPGQTLAWDEFQTQSAGNSPFRQGVAGGVTPSVTVSLDDMFASGSGGSLPAFPTASTSAFQTLEKLLSALPQSQIVFNSPIKEVSGEYTGVSTTTGPNTSTPADDLDEKESQQLTTITPHSSPSLHEHKQDTKMEDDDGVDEELEGLHLKENKLVDRVTFAVDYYGEDKNNVLEEDCSPQMNNPVEEEYEKENLEDLSKEYPDERNDVGDNMIDGFDGDSDKPSPNISADLEDLCSPAKPEAKFGRLNKNILKNIQNIQSPNVSSTKSSTSSSPPKHSSFKRVQEYIQSLPSPRHFTKKDPPSLSDDVTSPNKSSISITEDDTSSMCSGSRLSRQSNLSSLTGARISRGIIYGTSSMTSPTCPFPEEWQQTIPESIENNEDID